MAHSRLVISLSPSVSDRSLPEEAHRARFPAAKMGAREAQLALRVLDRAERFRIEKIGEREERAEAARAIVSSSRRPGVVDRLVDAIASPQRGFASHEIRRRGLLLDAWYRREHAAHRVGLSPLAHLLGIGILRNLAPNPFFDPVWYGRTHGLATDDVPLLHYLRDGAAQALAPSALFDAVAYLQAYPELAMEPDLLGHYISKGLAEGRKASVVQWSIS